MHYPRTTVCSELNTLSDVICSVIRKFVKWSTLFVPLGLTHYLILVQPELSQFNKQHKQLLGPQNHQRAKIQHTMHSINFLFRTLRCVNSVVRWVPCTFDSLTVFAYTALPMQINCVLCSSHSSQNYHQTFKLGVVDYTCIDIQQLYCLFLTSFVFRNVFQWTISDFLIRFFPFSPNLVGNCTRLTMFARIHRIRPPSLGSASGSNDPKNDTPSPTRIDSNRGCEGCDSDRGDRESCCMCRSSLPQKGEPIMPLPHEPAKLGLGRAGNRIVHRLSHYAIAALKLSNHMPTVFYGIFRPFSYRSYGTHLQYRR